VIPGAGTDSTKLLPSGQADVAILDIHDLVIVWHGYSTSHSVVSCRPERQRGRP